MPVPVPIPEHVDVLEHSRVLVHVYGRAGWYIFIYMYMCMHFSIPMDSTHCAVLVNFVNEADIAPFEVTVLQVEAK